MLPLNNIVSLGKLFGSYYFNLFLQNETDREAEGVQFEREFECTDLLYCVYDFDQACYIYKSQRFNYFDKL